MTRINQKFRNRRQRGFTLMEVMVTLPLVALLFGGTITLFTEAMRVAQRTSIAVQGSQDAANGMKYILGTTHEAIQFSLPPDTAGVNTNGMAFLPPDGSLNDYQTGGASSINTAVEMLMPGAATSVKTTGQAATPGFNLLDRTGHALTPAGYDRSQAQLSGGMPVSPLAGDLMCIYRGNSAGAPSPLNGQYLWCVRRPAGTLLADASHDVYQKLCKLILTQHADGTPATDAVQFIGRNTPGADIPASMPYELEFKLVCGDQSALQGTQTNEATDGSSVSALANKCALMRNHN